MLPIFQSDSKDISLLQTGWASMLNPVLKNAITSGVLLKGISLSSNQDNLVPHKLSKAYQGWILVSVVPKYPANYAVWNAWTPSYSASGSMTFTSVTSQNNVYKIDGDTCFVYLKATGTTGGTANTTLLVSNLPAKPSASLNASPFYPCVVSDGGNQINSAASLDVANTRLQVYKDPSTFTNWTLGSGRLLNINFSYPIDTSTTSTATYGGVDVWESSTMVSGATNIAVDTTKFLNLHCDGPMTVALYVF